jgi:proline dehydrogenase
LDVVRRLQRHGLGVSLDLFGEGVADQEAVERIVQRYLEVARALEQLDADVYLEIFPSHLGIDLSVGFL